MAGSWKNKLYFGDNLDIMRKYIPDESVDLIYLDPPFNSKATYNVLFQEKNGTESRAQITAFEDTWHWGLESEQVYHEIVTQGPQKLADLVQALRTFLGQNDMMAYLVMMAIRLVEMHRVLKPTGSIYLHCNPTASHYLKLVMDAVFGANRFQNEIIWYYTNAGGRSTRRCARKHQTLLFYSKSRSHWFDYKAAGIKRIQDDTEFGSFFSTDSDGRKYQEVRTPKKTYRYYLDEPKIPDDVWLIQQMGQRSKERLSYPTQKPETLLERVILLSSKKDDLVLDPFCGCGTTIAVAERLNRRWIGIDITYLAINLIKHRLADTFDFALSPYQVFGAPTALSEARALAEESRHQFEWWALGLVDAQPAQDKKKGADSGVDGYIYFIDDKSGEVKKIVIQVKSGRVSVSQVRDLKGVMEREKAVIGAFLTLEEPTDPMKAEAVAAGFYGSKFFLGKYYPKLQILTIEELLNGKRLQYPRLAPELTFKKAKRKKKGEPKQQRLKIEDG